MLNLIALSVALSGLCLLPVSSDIHVEVVRHGVTATGDVELELWHSTQGDRPDIVPVPATGGVTLTALEHGTLIRARRGATLFSYPHRVDEDSPQKLTLELKETGAVLLTVKKPGGLPAAGRSVLLFKALWGIERKTEYSTDSSGEVRIKRLPAGSVNRFELEEAGRRSKVDFSVFPGGLTRVELAVPGDYSVRGVVSWGGGRLEGPAGVTASLLGSNGLSLSKVESVVSSNGTFVIPVEQPGDYMVAADALGFFQPKPVTVNVSRDRGEAKCRLVLQPAATLAGDVVDEKGEPISDAMLLIMADPRQDSDEPTPMRFERAWTDAQGRFEFTQVNPELEYMLTVFASGEPDSAPINVESIRCGDTALRIIAPTLVPVATGRIECSDDALGEDARPWRLSVDGMDEHGLTETALTKCVIHKGGAFEVFTRVGSPNAIVAGGEYVLRLHDASWKVLAVESLQYPRVEPIVMSCDQAEPRSVRIAIEDMLGDGRERGIRLTVYRHRYSLQYSGGGPSEVGFVGEYAALRGRVELSLSPFDSYWLVAEGVNGGAAVHYLSREELSEEAAVRMVLSAASDAVVSFEHDPRHPLDDRLVRATLSRINRGQPKRVGSIEGKLGELVFDNLQPGVFWVQMSIGGKSGFDSSVEHCGGRRLIIQGTGDHSVEFPWDM